MTRHPGRLAALAGLIALTIGFLAPAGAAPQPLGGGNQGTVKIDGHAVDSTPANEPHVGCTFGVDFYNYEADLDVEMVFEAQPPTGTGELLVVTGTLDGDDATGADEAGWDGHFDIDLTDALAGYEPDPAQGYHVKLTVHAYDGDGNEADTKHKTFWIETCEPPETTTTTVPEETTTTTVPEETTTTTVPEETTTTTVPEETTTTTVPEETTTTTVPEETTTTTVPEETTTTEAGVLPTDVTPPTTLPTEVEGVQVPLPRTGFSTAMLTLGWVLLAGGLVAELAAFAQRRDADA